MAILTHSHEIYSLSGGFQRFSHPAGATFLGCLPLCAIRVAAIRPRGKLIRPQEVSFPSLRSIEKIDTFVAPVPLLTETVGLGNKNNLRQGGGKQQG